MNVFRLKGGNYTNQKFNGSALLLIPLVLVSFAISPMAQAVVPAPDGGYPGGNTAEGQAALLSLTTGGFNTAAGWLSLRSTTTGSFNTAVGAGTLSANTADQNTATGTGALLSSTIGFGNTANGAFALLKNTEGESNTAIGRGALFNNTAGHENTAIGGSALGNNTGNYNTALGFSAGALVSTANNVICIGASVFGADVSNSCYIGSIFGQTSASGAAVYVNSSNKLGTLTSSCRFKDDIKPMERVSEALFALKPVSFHYKKEIDPAGMQQFGLVAEEVEKVNPDLVVRDKEGKPYSVRYDQVNAMLLNEFLKEHRKVEQLEANDAEQQREIKALVATVNEQASQIQKVSAEIAVSKATPNVVLSSP